MEFNMEKICPNCGRNYEGDIYWVSSLRKHLARKNPCNRPKDVKYIREISQSKSMEFNTLDSVVWLPKPRPKYLFVHQITPWLFNEVFSNPLNVCFMQPNKNKNEILVKVSNNDKVIQVTIDKLIQLFVNHILIKLYTFEDTKFQEWLEENYIYLCNDWDGTFPDRITYINEAGKKIKSEPDFMIHMRKAVRDFLGTQTRVDKINLKNILLQ